MFLWVTSMDSVSLMSLKIGGQILHVRSGPSSDVPFCFLLKKKCFLLLQLGLTLSWDTWIKPAIVTFMMGVLPKRKVYFPLLGLSVRWQKKLIRYLQKFQVSLRKYRLLPLECCLELNLNKTFSWRWVGVPVSSAFALSELLSVPGCIWQFLVFHKLD